MTEQITGTGRRRRRRHQHPRRGRRSGRPLPGLRRRRQRKPDLRRTRDRGRIRGGERHGGAGEGEPAPHAHPARRARDGGCRQQRGRDRDGPPARGPRPRRAAGVRVRPARDVLLGHPTARRLRRDRRDRGGRDPGSRTGARSPWRTGSAGCWATRAPASGSGDASSVRPWPTSTAADLPRRSHRSCSRGWACPRRRTRATASRSPRWCGCCTPRRRSGSPTTPGWCSRSTGTRPPTASSTTPRPRWRGRSTAVRSPTVTGPVVLGGGILGRGGRLFDRLAAASGAEQVHAVADGALGVCVLALRRAGTHVDAAMFQRLATSLAALR